MCFKWVKATVKQLTGSKKPKRKSAVSSLLTLGAHKAKHHKHFNVQLSLIYCAYDT